MESIRRQPFWQHIRHPFTIAAKTSLSTKERIKAVALFFFGSLFALIGGPLLFYSYAYRLKAKQIRLLNSRQSAPVRKIQLHALHLLPIVKLPIQTSIPQPIKPQLVTLYPPALNPAPQPAAVAQPATTPTPMPAAVFQPASAPTPAAVAQPTAKPTSQPRPIVPPTFRPAAVPQPAAPQPEPAAPSRPAPAKSLFIDFGPLKLLIPQQSPLEKLYKSSHETLQRYREGTPVSYSDLAKTKRDVDALEVALNELAVHWLQISENSRDPRVREMARKALEDESGLTANIRCFIASAKRDVVRFTNQTAIDTNNLAQEVADLKKLPRELQDYRLESILASQYRLSKIKSDGNCGPRALAQGIGLGTEETVRKEVTHYQLQNLDDPNQPWRPFYIGNAENSIIDMQKPGCYFTDRELIAFSEVQKRPVGVLSIDSIEVKNNRLKPAKGYSWGEHFSGTPILLYHRPEHDNSSQQNQLELNHYDLLRPILPIAENHRTLQRMAPPA